MMKLMPNGCCFCFSLRTGGLILGWLHIVLGFLLSIVAFGSLAYVLQKNSDSDIINIGNGEFLEKPLFILVVSLAGFYYLFIAISAVLLIVGIEKNHHKKLIAFMVVLLIGIAYNVHEIINCIRIGLYNPMFKLLFRLSFETYLLWVLYSLYVKIKNGEKKTQISPA